MFDCQGEILKVTPLASMISTKTLLNLNQIKHTVKVKNAGEETKIFAECVHIGHSFALLRV